MNENWSDFEKFVFQQLQEIRSEIATLKARAAAWGSVAGVLTAAIGQYIIEHMKGK